MEHTTMEEERLKIKEMYHKASVVSNTDAVQGETLLDAARDAENAWYEHWTDDLEEDATVMEHEFYLTIVPIIRSRAAAERAGKSYPEPTNAPYHPKPASEVAHKALARGITNLGQVKMLYRELHGCEEDEAQEAAEAIERIVGRSVLCDRTPSYQVIREIVWCLTWLDDTTADFE